MIRRGDKGQEVVQLQEGLLLVGCEPGKADGIFGAATEMAVNRFQEKNSLFVDGIVGPSSAEVFNHKMSVLNARNLFLLFDKPDPDPFFNKEPKMKFLRCPADIFEGRQGYSRTTLRSDCAEAYKSLYAEVHELGGVITSAGGKRSLRQKSGKNRSRRSMHYTGLAFDMALPTGMNKPHEDPFIIEKDGARHWVVWARSSNPDAEVRKIESCRVRRRKNSKGKSYTEIVTETVEAPVFNFTELAAKHGFERIGARSSFLRGGSYGGAEWWHFQFEKALVPGKSKFGEELLKVYSLEECEKFVYWDDVKNSVFKKEWF